MFKRLLCMLLALLLCVNASPVWAEETTGQPKIVPFGELAAALAASRPEGEQWMGGVTSDSRIQCDSYVAFRRI